MIQLKCVKGEPDFSFLSIEKLRECERALQNVLFSFERCDYVSQDTLLELERMRKAYADEALKRVAEMPDKTVSTPSADKEVKSSLKKIPLKRKHLTRK